MSLPTCPSCIYAQGICEKTGVKIRHSTGCTYHKPKPATNADRIRAMSDEELASFMLFHNDQYDFDGWLDWLREEADNA